MQVNQTSHHHLPISESSFELKEGEVYRATIKEKLTDNEAVLQIKGKEQLAKFEDGVPSGNRVTILVSDRKEQMVNVKTIAADNMKAGSQVASEEKILQSIGLTGKESPVVKQSVQILLDKGAPISKEIVNGLKGFMETAQGSNEEKIETVKALANKRLDATQVQLRAVHEALHGKPLNEVLSNLAKEIDPKFKLEPKETVSKSQQEPVVQRGTTPSAKEVEPVKVVQPQAASNPTNEGIKKDTNATQISELVRNSRELVEKEPDLRKAIQQIREDIIKNPKIDRESAQKIEKAALEAEKLQSIGKDRLIQALKNVEVQLLKKEHQPTQSNVTASLAKTSESSSNQEGRLAQIVKELNVEVSKNPNLSRSIEKVKEQIIENPRFPKEVVDKVNKAVNEAATLMKQGRVTTGKEVLSNALTEVTSEVDKLDIKANLQVKGEQTNATTRPSEIVKEVKAEVQRDPNLNRGIEKVRDQVVNHLKMDREVAQKVEKALTEATQLQKIGQETIGRDRIQQALIKAEVELKQIESRQLTHQTQSAQTDRSTLEARPSEIVKEVKAEIQRDPNLNRVIEKVRDQVVNHPKMDREVAQKIEKALTEAAQLQKIGQETIGRDRIQQALAKVEVELKQIESRQPTQQTQSAQTERSTSESRPSEIVKEVKAEIQRDPNLNRVIEKVRDQVVNHPKMDREVAQKIEKALTEAAQLQKIGQETIGRDRIQQALAKVEVELKQIESRQSTQPSQSAQMERSTPEPRPSEIVKEVKAEVQRDPNLNRVIEKVRDQIVNHPKMDREVAQKVEKALTEAAQIQKVGQQAAGRDRIQQALTKAEVELKQIESRQPTQQTQSAQTDRSTPETRPSEIVKEVKAEVQRDPNLNRVIEKVRDQIVNYPKVDREVAQKVEKALTEATQLQKVGQEAAGRDRIQQALAKAEVELKQIEARQITQQPMQDSQSQGQQQLSEDELPKQDTQQIRESIKQVRAQAQTEPDINKVLQKVQEQIINNKRIDPELVRDIERLAKQATQLDQAGRERLTKVLQQVEESMKQTDTQAKTAENSTNMNAKDQTQMNNQQPNNSAKNTELTDQAKINEIRPSELIKQALKQLQKEPDLERALNQVRKEITSHPSIDMKTFDRAEKAITHATQLQDKGREIAARQHITKELTQMEQDLAKTEPALTTSPKATPDVQYDLNEQLQSLNIQSKDIIVTKVTQKLAQATHDFRELKREISRNLDNVERLINTYKKNAYPQAKQMLETAISKLDNAILKSEMMLLTDMKTEKQLMQASTQLAEAKKLLAKGEHSEAGKIVSEVKTLVNKLIFKPTEQKMMHFVNKESMALENRSPSQQMLSQFGDTTRGLANQEPSARQMFEMVRSLGLNHDSDVANSLVFQKNEQSQQEQQQQQNLKAALLKLTQGEETNSKVAQQAEQALTNLTGQQLLSKSDASGTLQSMFFNLPMMLGEKPENLQVFINSKNEGQQVDWENCNLYFLLETRKLGDVGILLNTTDRNLSITIKNDLPGFKERMEPLASLTKEKLEEVGYNVGSINFTRMSSSAGKTSSQEGSETQASGVKKSRPVFTEKGMDFKI